jgi:uric acid-xanthine permease
MIVGGIVQRARRKLTTRHGWLGDYDYGWLCMPTFPWGKRARRRNIAPPFYALDQELPLMLAITTGLQHALAMLAGMSFELIFHSIS